MAKDPKECQMSVAGPHALRLKFIGLDASDPAFARAIIDDAIADAVGTAGKNPVRVWTESQKTNPDGTSDVAVVVEVVSSRQDASYADSLRADTTARLGRGPKKITVTSADAPGVKYNTQGRFGGRDKNGKVVLRRKPKRP